MNNTALLPSPLSPPLRHPTSKADIRNFFFPTNKYKKRIFEKVLQNYMYKILQNYMYVCM